MKRQQTKCHTHTMSNSQVIRSKKSFIVRSNFSCNCSTVFSLHRYFIEAATTDIEILLQV